MADPENPARPPQDVQEISTPAQFAALAHPLRQRLLFTLGSRQATISQLAVRLDAKKGSVAHHLKVLREAGLVHVAETRQVRGGTEQYYLRTARKMYVPEPHGPGTAAMLGAVAEEMERSPAPTTLTLRNVRLSPERAGVLAGELERLVDEAEEKGVAEPVHGVLVALYRHASPADEASQGS
jgi:DNA-binding transcriptional ArsR family regulator